MVPPLTSKLVPPKHPDFKTECGAICTKDSEKYGESLSLKDAFCKMKGEYGGMLNAVQTMKCKLYGHSYFDIKNRSANKPWQVDSLKACTQFDYEGCDLPVKVLTCAFLSWGFISDICHTHTSKFQYKCWKYL